MGEGAAVGAEVGVGRSVEEVRDAAGVDIGVALDLAREVALVIFRKQLRQKQPPPQPL